MRSNQPPKVAKWLLRHFGCSRNNDAVIGDLDERYRQGRSGLWYWQQMLVALLIGFASEVRQHKLLVSRAMVIGWMSFSAYGVAVIALSKILRAVLSAIIESKIMSGPTGLGVLNRYFHIQETFFRFRLPWPLSLVIIMAVFCVGWAIAGRVIARLLQPHQRVAVLAFATLQVLLMLFFYRGDRSMVVPTLVAILWGGEFFTSHPGNGNAPVNPA